MPKSLYLCFASRYAEPNVVPALWNAERFERIAIVVGQNNPPTPEDISNAVSPADRYRWMFGQRVNVPVQMVKARPYEADEVAREVSDLLARANGVDDIVVNVTGGTVPMNFGAVRAVQEWADGAPGRGYQIGYFTSRPNPELLVVEKKGHAPDLVRSPDRGGAFRLKDLLGLRGLISLGEETIGKAHRARRPLVEAMWQSAGPNATPHHGFTAADLGIVIAVQAGYFDGRASAPWKRAEKEDKPLRLDVANIAGDLDRRLPGKRTVDRDALLARLREWSEGMTEKQRIGLLVEGDRIVLPVARLEATLRFLGGGWFEELVYWRTVDAAGRLGLDARIMLNLRLKAKSQQGPPPPGGPARGPGQETFELDVAVFANGQLNAFECKAGKFAGRGEAAGINRFAMDRLIALKGSVIGPGGRLALITFREFPHEHESAYAAVLRTVLKSHSIGLGCGLGIDQAIEDFLRAL